MTTAAGDEGTAAAVAALETALRDFAAEVAEALDRQNQDLRLLLVEMRCPALAESALIPAPTPQTW